MTVSGKTTGEHTFNIYVKNAEGKWYYRDFTIKVGNSSKVAYNRNDYVEILDQKKYPDTTRRTIYFKNSSYSWHPEVEYKLFCKKYGIWVEKKPEETQDKEWQYIKADPNSGEIRINGVWTRDVTKLTTTTKANAKGEVRIRFKGETTYKSFFF